MLERVQCYRDFPIDADECGTLSEALFMRFEIYHASPTGFSPFCNKVRCV